MNANGYLDYDPSTYKFSSSEEHVAVLLDRDNVAFTILFVYWIPSLSFATDELLEAFKTGKGVPFSSYDADMLFAQGVEGNRPNFLNDVANWISSMPDIEIN